MGDKGGAQYTPTHLLWGVFTLLTADQESFVVAWILGLDPRQSQCTGAKERSEFEFDVLDSSRYGAKIAFSGSFWRPIQLDSMIVRNGEELGQQE